MEPLSIAGLSYKRKLVFPRIGDPKNLIQCSSKASSHSDCVGSQLQHVRLPLQLLHGAGKLLHHGIDETLVSAETWHLGSAAAERKMVGKA